jgi:hypothetical protein
MTRKLQVEVNADESLKRAGLALPLTLKKSSGYCIKDVHDSEVPAGTDKYRMQVQAAPQEV